MEENLEENARIITLRDENGDEIEFELLALIDYNDNNYVVLLPVDESEDEEDEGEVIILQRENTDNGEDDEFESYISVDDEDTLNAVFEKFKNDFSDDFDFVE